MDFLELLVIKECTENYLKTDYPVKKLINIVLEAFETQSFLEEKVLESKKPKKIIKESWKNKLSKVNWNNLLENEDEDEDDEGEVEIKDPFDGDEDATPVEEDPEPVSQSVPKSKKDKRYSKLKRIKDAMLLLRWSAMKKRSDLIDSLDTNQPLETKIKILRKLGYTDENSISEQEANNLASQAKQENDNEVPDSVKSILTPSNVQAASDDLARLIYRVRQTDDGYDVSSGLFKKAIVKAHTSSRKQFSEDEIFSTFVINLINFLQNKGKKGWNPLPEKIGNLSDLENDDSKVLDGIAYYLVRMIANAPKEDAKRATDQLNPVRDRSWADTESGEGFRRVRDKKAIVNQDIKNQKFEFYIKIIDALRGVQSWDSTAKAQLNSINPAFYEDEGDSAENLGKLRKGIISDLFIAKLLPDASVSSSQDVKKLLSTFLEMLKRQDSKSIYKPITHASSLRKDSDEDGGGGEDIDIARYNNSMRGGNDDNFGGSDGRDPAQIAIDAEEERSKPTQVSFFDAFKNAMDDLLRKNPSWGLSYCLSKNLNCTGGFPDSSATLSSWSKVKAKEVALKLTELLKPSAPFSDAQIGQFINKAKNHLISYFQSNYPSLMNNLLMLLGKK